MTGTKKRKTFKSAYHTIASRFPPIDLFEDIEEDPENWGFLIDLEMATNDRIKDEVGDVSLVSPEESISGPGATIIMAAFTHVNPVGSRFTDGTFGAYYASDSFETSLMERIHHLEKHLLASPHSTDDLDQRVYVGSITGVFETIKNLQAPEMDPNNYEVGQKFGSKLKKKKADGIIFPSVRHQGHVNIAALKPNIVEIPRQERHIQLHFDGHKISKYFDFTADAWIKL